MFRQTASAGSDYNELFFLTMCDSVCVFFVAEFLVCTSISRIINISISNINESETLVTECDLSVCVCVMVVVGIRALSANEKNSTIYMAYGE